MPPSAVGMTTELPPWTIATKEFVVPKSMPIIFAMRDSPGETEDEYTRVLYSCGSLASGLARAGSMRLDLDAPEQAVPAHALSRNRPRLFVRGPE